MSSRHQSSCCMISSKTMLPSLLGSLTSKLLLQAAGAAIKSSTPCLAGKCGGRDTCQQRSVESCCRTPQSARSWCAARPRRCPSPAARGRSGRRTRRKRWTPCHRASHRVCAGRHANVRLSRLNSQSGAMLGWDAACHVPLRTMHWQEGPGGITVHMLACSTQRAVSRTS